MDHTCSSLNRKGPPPVDESCTICQSQPERKGKRREGSESITQMAFFFHGRCHSLSFHIFCLAGFVSVDNDKLLLWKPNASLSPWCRFLHKRHQIASNRSPCEANEVKLSQQIMQRGYEVNCQ